MLNLRKVLFLSAQAQSYSFDPFKAETSSFPLKNNVGNLKSSTWVWALP